MVTSDASNASGFSVGVDAGVWLVGSNGTTVSVASATVAVWDGVAVGDGNITNVAVGVEDGTLVDTCVVAVNVDVGGGRVGTV